MAAPHHPDADPDGGLSVGLGGSVSRHEPAAAGDRHLPRLLSDVVRRADPRTPRTRARRCQRGDRSRARANRHGGRIDAAPVCRLPGLGSTTGRGSGAALRVPARARRRSARDRGRAPRGADAHDRRTRHAARVRHLAGQVPERLADDGHALHRGLRAALCRRADDCRANEEGVRGCRVVRDIRGADSALRLPGAGADRAGGLFSLDPLRHAVCAARDAGLASLGDPRLEAVFHLLFLRSCRRSVVVSDASADRAARHGGIALRGLWALLSRRAHRCAAYRGAARAAVGRRCGRLRQPRHAAVSRRRPTSGGRPLGHGLPAGPAQRGPVRRKRCRPSADSCQLSEAHCRGWCSACGGAMLRRPSASCRR